MNTWNDGNVEIHRSKIKEKDKRIAELEMSLKRIEDAEDKVYQAYEERIADLEAKLAQAKISEEDAWSEFRELSVRDGKIITALESAEAEAMSVVASLEGTVGRFKAERDQLAASLETHNVARQKAEQRELAACAELDEIAASLETARTALESMCAEFRGLDLPYGSKAYLSAREALAQIAKPSAALEERDRAVRIELLDKMSDMEVLLPIEDFMGTKSDLTAKFHIALINKARREFGLEE